MRDTREDSFFLNSKLPCYITAFKTLPNLEEVSFGV
jgi:hypothetical protein